MISTNPDSGIDATDEDVDIVIDVNEPSALVEPDHATEVNDDDSGILTSANPVLINADLRLGQMRDPSLDPTILGRYKILGVLGRGAFSVVYRASQVGIGRIVALKVFLLPPATRQNSELAEAALARFHREARLAASLRHPNTVTLFDYDQTAAGILYMAFEYVDGPTLHRALKDNSDGMSVERSLNVIRQVALSLGEAHAQGIIHRDLKPGNIMLTQQQGQDDYVKVLDFGIAKLISKTERNPNFDPEQTNVLDVFDSGGIETASGDLTLNGRIIGTPRYIPPEQIRSEELTPAADLYALGLILHEALAGRPANPGRDPKTLLRWHLEDNPLDAAPGYCPPSGLAQVIAKATAKNPSERYQTCREFLTELDQIDDRGQWKKVNQKSRMLPLAIGLNVLMLVILTAALYGAVFSEEGAVQNASVSAPQKEAPAQDVEAPKEGARTEVQAAKSAEKEVEIVSNPAGATIFMGGLEIGTTPMSLTLEEREEDLKLLLKKVGFRDARVTLSSLDADSPFPVKLRRAIRKTKSKRATRKKPKYHILK